MERIHVEMTIKRNVTSMLEMFLSSQLRMNEQLIGYERKHEEPQEWNIRLIGELLKAERYKVKQIFFCCASLTYFWM